MTTNSTLQPIQLAGQYEISSRPTTDKPTEVTKTSPCPHCGKPDWCYSIGELAVCNRDAEPASGWERTAKSDLFSKAYYTLAQPKKLPIYLLSNGQKLNNVFGGMV